MTRKKTISEACLQKWLSPMMVHMTPAQQHELLSLCSIRHYAAGEVIVDEGDVPNLLYCLLDGVAKISLKGDADKWQTLRWLKEGEYFGYRAFFAHQNHKASYFAMTNAVVCLIPLDFIQKCMEKRPALKDYFLHHLAVNLWQSDYGFVCMIQKHLRGRMAATLLSIAQYFGFESDGKTLNFMGSRAELANRATMTTANAIRTLSSFEKEGLIVLNHRKISLLDMEALRFVSTHD